MFTRVSQGKGFDGFFVHAPQAKIRSNCHPRLQPQVQLWWWVCTIRGYVGQLHPSDASGWAFKPYTAHCFGSSPWSPQAYPYSLRISVAQVHQLVLHGVRSDRQSPAEHRFVKYNGFDQVGGLPELCLWSVGQDARRATDRSGRHPAGQIHWV